jgi:hypothetical protein
MQGRALHQLLHGYAEGHRLLESSFRVQDDLTRLMLRLSDLSGSSIVSGFEDYITGYPLPSINAYALAKTWYAPEMPRPGCVWTHTIVVPAQVMGEIPSLTILTDLFRRPTEEGFRGQYDKDLSLDKVAPHKVSVFVSRSDQTRETFPQLVSSYYGSADRPVLLAAKSSREFEEIVFALWSQQWPTLRLRFTFCTGSLAARNFAGLPFDLQCVPTSIARQVLLETSAGSLAEPILLPAIRTPYPGWIPSVVKDALIPHGGKIREFLWAAGGRGNTRADFAPFMRVFDALSELSPLSNIIALVAELFPEPSLGLSLKKLLFGKPAVHRWLAAYEEQDILIAIATTSNYQMFDAEDLSIKERTASICREKPDSARWLVRELFRSSLNPLGEEILASLIAAMEPEMAGEITSKYPQFLPGLFRAKPSLASSSQLWRVGGDRKRELFESVASHDDLESALVAEIVTALLESASDQFIKRALDRWGKPAVFQTLDWIEAHKGAMSEPCREALTFYLSFVMEWVESGTPRAIESLVAAAHVVAPYSSRVLQHDSLVWLNAFRSLRNSHKEADKNYVGAFLLALAFRNARPAPLDLVAESFEPIHEAARIESLSDDAWIILEPLVPELSWLSNWDKCERLRRGLISAFLRNSWPASELERRIKDHDLVQQLLTSARKVDGGDEFLRRITLSR